MNPSSDFSAQKTRGKAVFSILRGTAIYLTLFALLFLALRSAPLPEIWRVLKQLRLWQMMALLSINAVIYALVTLRWWIIVRAENRDIAYPPLIAVRVAVFGISYFTLGPQIGGEPLQVLYLQRKHRLTYTRATSTVIMDKLLEFLANFFLLGTGLMAILQAGILSINGSRPLVSLSGLVILMTWPPIHVILLYRDTYPLTLFLRSIPFIRKDAKAVRFVAASERMAGAFCRRRFSSLVSATLVSLLAAVGMVSEFFLITAFLKIHLPISQIIAAWTAGWLAFLVPLPGGLGALEASQVFALGAFGVSAASAISVALVMRGRDLLIGGIGLLLAGRGYGRKN